MPMKSYESFADWKKDQSKLAQSLIAPLRNIIKSADPKLVEVVKWGQGSFLKDELPICYIHAKAESVQLGFYVGVRLKDPKKKLRGNGKYLRFLSIESKGDIDAGYFAGLVKQASKIRYR